MTRAGDAVEAADIVAELLESVAVDEVVLRDLAGGARRVVRHRFRAAGLLAQLADMSVPSGALGGDGPRGKPASRAPVTGSWDLADEIWHAAEDLRLELREALGYGFDPEQRLPRTSGRHPASFLPSLIARADDEIGRSALERLRAWRSRARVALRYDVPTVELRDVSCPYCGGPLRVRQDASSDVWCATPECADWEGERLTWPRGSWVLLLDGLAS